MARLARSLDRLRSEIRAKNPMTQVDWIGDAAHQKRASDHNPNAAGVVCAIDVYPSGRETTGKVIDLAAFAEFVRTRRHPAGKYVIYRQRIALASNGWKWRTHTGDYHPHVHVSVGVGPDGQSTGPYDNLEEWGWGSVKLPTWQEGIIKTMDTVDLSHVTSEARTYVHSPDVALLQGLLMAHGYGPTGLVASNGLPDGIGGPKTRAALGDYQRGARTGKPADPGTPDYIAGPATWAALLK